MNGGGRAVLRPLVRAYEPAGRRIALGILGNADDAGDALQEAFVKAWGNLKRCDVTRPYLRNAAGGEIHEYTKLKAEAREQSVDQMVQEAARSARTRSWARFQTSEVMAGAPEMMCYGTAVVLAATAP